MGRRFIFIVSKFCGIPDPGSVELFWGRLRLFIEVLTGEDEIDNETGEKNSRWNHI